MPVRVVGDEPLLHARLALRTITAAIRHSTLPLLTRTVVTAGANRDCGVNRQRTRGRRDSSLTAVLIQEPHELGLARIDLKALDCDFDLARRKTLLDPRSAHFGADARLGPFIHPAVSFGIMVSSSIDRHRLVLKSDRSPSNPCSVPEPTGTHLFLHSPKQRGRRREEPAVLDRV